MVDQEQYRGQLKTNLGHINGHMAEFTQEVVGSDSVFLTDLMNEVRRSRPELTPLHFGLLIYSAYRYALLKHLPPEVLSQLGTWNGALGFLKGNGERESIKECVLKRNVNITSPYRYGALAFAAKVLYQYSKPDILDVGCGFYPDGIGSVRPEFLPNATDSFSQNVTAALSMGGINFGRVWALDIQPPDSMWTASCKWEGIDKLSSSFQTCSIGLERVNSSIPFFLADVTSPRMNLEDLKVDISFMANILYQLNEEQRAQALRNVAKITNDNGWFLSAEYLKGGSRRRPFTFGVTGMQKVEDGMFSEPKVLFLLDSADCMRIRNASV